MQATGALSPTQHRFRTDRLTIHRYSSTESIKRPTRSTLETRLPISLAAPAILPTPPSPLHHFLAALGHPSQWITVWNACIWQIIVIGLGRKEPSQVDVCISYATSCNDC